MTARFSLVPSRVGRPGARFGLTLALGGLILVGCGSNPAGTTPGSGAAQLPPQTNPGIKGNDTANQAQTGPTANLTGSVTDALSGKPVSNAQLFVMGVAVAAAPASSTASPSPAGGGGGPAPSPVPSLATSPSAAPSGLASASPGPGAKGSPVPGVSPSPLSSAPAAAGSAVPMAAATPMPLKELKADGKGHFELKDLPQGTYDITLVAPGYEARTYEGPLPKSLDVTLRPLTPSKKVLHDMPGVVREATSQPAGNVQVLASAMLGQYLGAQATTDDTGHFTLKGLVSGNYAVAAWTTGLTGEIDTFAMLDEVPLDVGREQRSVSPTLVLHAVSEPILLAGTVTGTPKADGKKEDPDAVRPLSVRAYLHVGQGEIPLLTVPVGQDGYFRMHLPALPDGASYHLAAAGRSANGQSVYVHRYDLTAGDAKIDLALPEGPGALDVTSRTVAAGFGWEPKATSVAAYRLTLETVGRDARTIWQGWTTGTALQLPASKDFTLLKPGESYRATLTAITLGDKGDQDLQAIPNEPWSQSQLSAPTTFEVEKAGKAAATPKPEASSASAKRYKPIDHL